MKKFLLAATAAISFVAVSSPANAAEFIQSQSQTVAGQNFTFLFSGLPSANTAGTLTFLTRGDFSIGASLGESFAFDLDGVVSGSGIQANGGNLITSFDFNDNLFQTSFAITLAELQTITSDGMANLTVDYADGVNIINPNSGIRATLAFGAAAVPEPATWAFMIFGFGAIGGAMRRQRKANVKVSYA